MGFLDGLGGIGAMIGGVGGGLIGGPAGAALGASLLGGIGGQADANAANQANMNLNLADQDYWLRNRHQIETQDLIKAGLNPVLSANAGGPVPSGAMATQQSTMQGLGAGASTALQLAQLKTNMENTQADTNKKNMEAKALKWDATKSDTISNIFQSLKSSVKDIDEGIFSNRVQTGSKK